MLRPIVAVRAPTPLRAHLRTRVSRPAVRPRQPLRAPPCAAGGDAPKPTGDDDPRVTKRKEELIKGE